MFEHVFQLFASVGLTSLDVENGNLLWRSAGNPRKHYPGGTVQCPRMETCFKTFPETLQYQVAIVGVFSENIGASGFREIFFTKQQAYSGEFASDQNEFPIGFFKIFQYALPKDMPVIGQGMVE